MYQLLRNPFGEPRVVRKLGEKKDIPFDEKNMDYQEYKRWLAEGNEPLPPEPAAENPAS